MPIPQVNDRIKEAPVVVLRAVFAGIGQILLTADKVRARAAEQVLTQDPPPARAPVGRSRPESAASVSAASPVAVRRASGMPSCPAAMIDPSIITGQKELYVDIDVDHGASYGETLFWDAGAELPPYERLATVQFDVDTKKLYDLYIKLMTQPPPHPK